LADACPCHAHDQQNWQSEGWAEPAQAARLGGRVDASSNASTLYGRQLEGLHLG
jgi:hypothetical protein